MSHANGAGGKKMPETRCAVKSREGIRCPRPARTWGVCRQHAIKTGLAAKRPDVALTLKTAARLRGDLTSDPMLDAVLCGECLKEFIPKRDGQKTCERPACAGGIGARKRDYRKRTPKEKPRVR